MISFDEWMDNYINILNKMYNEFINISDSNNIQIINNENTFHKFSYMIYNNSKNYKLYDERNFDYV